MADEVPDACAVTFILNGREVGVEVGCKHGVCGACTVWLEGQPVRGCLLFTVQVEGASVIAWC